MSHYVDNEYEDDVFRQFHRSADHFLPRSLRREQRKIAVGEDGDDNDQRLAEEQAANHAFGEETAVDSNLADDHSFDTADGSPEAVRQRLLFRKEDLDRSGIAEEECRLRCAILAKLRQLAKLRFPCPVVIRDRGANSMTRSPSANSVMSSASASRFNSSFAQMSMDSFSSFQSSASFGSAEGLRAALGSFSNFNPNLTDAQLDKLLAKMKTKHERDKKKKGNYQKVHYKAGGIHRRNLKELDDSVQEEEEERADIVHLEPIWFGNVESQWRRHWLYPLIVMQAEEGALRNQLLQEAAEQRMNLSSELLAPEVEAQGASMIHAVNRPMSAAEQRRKWEKARNHDGEPELDECSLLRKNLASNENGERSRLWLKELYARSSLIDEMNSTLELMTPPAGNRAGSRAVIPAPPQVSDTVAAKARLNARKQLVREENAGRMVIDDDMTLGYEVLYRYWKHNVYREYVYVPLK